ncbi:VIT1/CCC1 transporter family protein [Aquimarina intermedia]|uniref:VIT1/CCC1 family predicted Fe2+/Mn2+ transporter n=1 Tax=Aquimarina intermedia TaxID=350814 RepID=A0A5S5C336_9FLAO|nr:VIT1/CCC1 transporter family protein [Aquimarina intermedia]TYP73559.1 VIT1/CCC1 family predicted Fe2+/Mn2+ transporter [Aquimarina intermedia]
MKKLKQQLQVEVDTAFLYTAMAARERDDVLKKVLLALAKIEQGHAKHMLVRIQEVTPMYEYPQPSLRAKIQLRLGKVFGYDHIIGMLSGTERQMARIAVQKKLKAGEQLSGFEHNHLRIIEAVSKNKDHMISGGLLSKFEGRHKSVGGNAVRAAVLGANDGLVSNMSLVMGVAGAAAQSSTILLTGLAGLLAGAISMSLGEWLSVQSSRELYQRQIALEAEELEAAPEEEKQELVLLYQAKGMDEESAQSLADKIFENKDTALDALIVEELGIDKEELGGSAWEAALVSFFLFAIGAILPVIPYFFTSDRLALWWSLGCSVFGLFVIGASITLFTGKSLGFSGFRQVLFGLVAAAVTYGVGTLIGVTITG